MTLPQGPHSSSEPIQRDATGPSDADGAAGSRAGAATNVDPTRGWAFRFSRAGLVGIGSSLILHSILLTVFAVVTIAGGGGGGTALIGAPVEVALVDSSEVVSLNEGPITADAPGVEETKGQIDLAPMPVVNSAGGSGLTDAGDIGGNMGTGLGGAGAGTGIGVGNGSGGAGAGGAGFFGVEARGQRFAYVVDISGSMDGEKLDMLKRELIKSIDRLAENASFVVLCFSSDVAPLGNNSKLVPATSKNKKNAIEAITSLRSSGGTEPMPALATALRNRPRPDAVYFMTDGLFDAGVVDSLKTELRAGRNVPMHCITLIDRSSEGLMRRIAQMSDGSYTHIDNFNVPAPGNAPQAPGGAP